MCGALASPLVHAVAHSTGVMIVDKVEDFAKEKNLIEGKDWQYGRPALFKNELKALNYVRPSGF